MNEAVKKVIKKYPGREAQIWQLWSKDDDFQELCKDYALCIDTLVSWADETVLQTRKAEYRTLRQRLEFEIEFSIGSTQLQSE
jgi:hypothetical protein